MNTYLLNAYSIALTNNIIDCILASGVNSLKRILARAKSAWGRCGHAVSLALNRGQSAVESTTNDWDAASNIVHSVLNSRSNARSLNNSTVQVVPKIRSKLVNIFRRVAGRAGHTA